MRDRHSNPNCNPCKTVVKKALASHMRKHHKSGGKTDEHWIQKAIKKPGALRKKLHVKKGHDIPEYKLEKAEHSSNKRTAAQARLAETLKKFHK